MNSTVCRTRLFLFCLAGAIALAAAFPARAQQPQAPSQQQPLPEGYIRPAPPVPGQAPNMKAEQVSTARTFKVTFSTGDELLSGLTELATKNHISAAYITGLGGFTTATLGWGDPPRGAFKKIAVDQKCELVSLTGNISLRDGKPYVHLHAVVAYSDGSTKAGHLIDAHVNPIAEIFVVETAPVAASPASP